MILENKTHMREDEETLDTGGGDASDSIAVTNRLERELRLALVCYGGVSLAVYMHGITKEILKLVRASRSIHSIRDRLERTAGCYGDHSQDEDRIDSEAVYFDLLCAIGQQVELRVIVDVVAGASAGGINAIMLARALAYDLSLDGHRDLWLSLADVSELLDPEGRAGLWSKPYMRPFFRMVNLWKRHQTRKLGGEEEDPEVSKKLSLFMRSRWFEPPFSGPRMSEMMLDAVTTMGGSKGESRSLLPDGQELELFVTTTDFWGHREDIVLHDPAIIAEREHRHILRFSYLKKSDGTVISQMGDAHIPSLAFAARATSCFPGAFPPARFAEMDELLEQRGIRWLGRAAFIADNFAALTRAGEDPEQAAFIDGSVLMNKPISLAIEAIQSRAAQREVDRRLVYIEPNPEISRDSPREIPGFFKTIKSALSDIPRNQPIRDDLEWLADFNTHVRARQQVVDAIKPKVVEMVTQLLGERIDAAPDVGRLITWRGMANESAARDASYAYDGYARFKVLSVLSNVTGSVQNCAANLDAVTAEAMVDSWSWRMGIRPLGNASAQAQDSDSVAWIHFLRRFDVQYRIRRIRFLIRRLNALYYNGTGADTDMRLQHVWLNSLKKSLYRHLDRVKGLAVWPDCRTEPTDETIDILLETMASRMALTSVDIDLDQLLATAGAHCPYPGLWREVVITYLGFAYYDVLTLPMSHWRSLDELDEIKVDRISVNDANTLRKGAARDILKGVELGNFGAFFSRHFRENDYLWGRLTGAERLVDILASAVPEAVESGRFDVLDAKKRLFLAILDAEAPHLVNIRAEIAALRKDAEALDGQNPASTSELRPG